MQFDVVDTTGKVVGATELDESVWGIEPHLSVVHQALVRQNANARLGTHKAKGRSEVSGGGRKPWRQKGTGRARQGSTRAAQWVGGGIIFGPTPRKYTQAMPRKMRQLAIRSVLSAKVQDERLTVVKGLQELDGKTKSMKAVVEALPESRSMLIVVPGTDSPAARAAANLPNTKTVIAGMLNVRDVLKFDRLVVTEEAISQIEELWALDEASRQPSQWKLDRQAAAEEVA
ncbi:MAG: 50S ribosomal protein L4 [Thermomicrobiales bacterium]|nr:50S ribosomal protein L4 [Thermomicrobiales bacterium]MCO5218789.1 50S ribosomal protein L4 [Thermomicrobiales bacterium]MCO5225992.1 50S ribosomal protein L4 [Thermomicrobiales bacterium]MCO5229139.1 50S ribosomal protein L4 [Thermomicrobiales bacterium]